MRLFVTEFADSKREIERHLNDVTEPIIEHLLKLYFMPNHESRNHWCTEIYSFLNRIKKLSGKNKRPTKAQILSWTYNKWSDVLEDKGFIDSEIESIEELYNVTIPKSNIYYKQFNTVCYDYFNWIATELSDKGYISFPSIRNKLNELF